MYELHRVASPKGPPPALKRDRPYGGAPCTSAQPRYPYEDGDVIVLGPECFVSKDARVLCWKGQNYIPQPQPLSWLDLFMLAPLILGILALLTAALVAGKGC